MLMLPWRLASSRSLLSHAIASSSASLRPVLCQACEFLMISQIEPPLPLRTTRGGGLALFLIDYGLEHNLVWVVMLDESGELWCLDNTEVRGYANATFRASRGPDPSRAAQASSAGPADPGSPIEWSRCPTCFAGSGLAAPEGSEEGTALASVRGHVPSSGAIDD